MSLKTIMLAALFTSGALCASAKDYHYTTVPGDAMQTRIYTLDNGLKVYMSVNKEKPRLQVNIAVKQVRVMTLPRLLVWLTIWST